MMSASEALTFHELFLKAQSLAEREGRESGARLVSIEILESADGSRRWRAIVHLQVGERDDVREQDFAIVAPAPHDAPSWAPRSWGEVDLTLYEYGANTQEEQRI